MIDKATVDRIYAAANIVEVVSDFVQLKKRGSNYLACCPFHNEKTPSFVVTPSKGLFKCFGCGEGGNAVTFVMKHENMTYPEALKYVARKYGIEVRERELTPEETQRNDDRESMLVVSHWAADFFEKQMWGSDEGKSVALSYFRSRGFTDATIKKFGLGYCPRDGEAMTRTAINEGYKEEFLTATGLTIKRDDGRTYDRFFGRVMFPIHSVSGRVTAFGGRTLRTDKKVAKYVNSPESEIYHKSNILYGLFFAKRAITQQDVCIMTEGYTDVISMHQSGVENVVSSSGTSLTTEQIRLIGRFTKNITVIYDGDAAGINASMRGIDMILREGMNVRVVPMPEGEDPDSFARTHSAAEVREYITAHEEDFISFKARKLLADAGSDPLKRAALITDVVASIAEIPEAIMRSVYIQDTAQLLKIDQQLVAEEVARKRLSHGSDTQTREFIRTQQQEVHREEALTLDARNVAAGSSVDELERELVKCLIKYGHLDFDYKEGRDVVQLNVAGLIINDLEANGLTLRNPQYKALYDSYIEFFNASAEPAEAPMPRFVNHPDPEVSAAAVDILTEDDNYIVSKLWEKHDIVVESETERLAVMVPRLVILYKSKAIELIINTLQAQLTPDLSEEDERDILFRIAALNKERSSIAGKLSRLIL